MEQTIHGTGYRASGSEQRTVRGAIVFLALVALALLAVAAPELAAGAAIGGVGGHLVGIKADGRRA